MDQEHCRWKWEFCWENKINNGGVGYRAKKYWGWGIVSTSRTFDSLWGSFWGQKVLYRAWKCLFLACYSIVINRLAWSDPARSPARSRPYRPPDLTDSMYYRLKFLFTTLSLLQPCFVKAWDKVIHVSLIFKGECLRMIPQRKLGVYSEDLRSLGPGLLIEAQWNVRYG